MQASKILVADDHPMCAAALTMAAHAVDAAHQVSSVATLGEAEAALRGERFDLVLLDLMLPDVQGFAGLAVARQSAPATPIAIVSSRDDLATMRRSLELGARGYIAKSAPMDRMIAAIRVLLAGGTWFTDEVLTTAGTPATNDAARRVGTLSIAQLRVLRAIAGGQQNKQIAYELGLAEPTVKSHLAAIFRKLGVTNRTQAVLVYRSVEQISTVSEADV